MNMENQASILLPGDNDVIEPYASMYVATFQPIGGWNGRSAIMRLQDIETKAIPKLLIKMKGDWERVCRRYIGKEIWTNSLSNLSISEMPKIVAYDQPFISTIFDKYGDILIALIEKYLADGEVDVDALIELLALKRAELMLKGNSNSSQLQRMFFTMPGEPDNDRQLPPNERIPAEILGVEVLQEEAYVIEGLFGKTNFVGLKIMEEVKKYGLNGGTVVVGDGAMRDVFPGLFRKAADLQNQQKIAPEVVPDEVIYSAARWTPLSRHGSDHG